MKMMLFHRNWLFSNINLFGRIFRKSEIGRDRISVFVIILLRTIWAESLIGFNLELGLYRLIQVWPIQTSWITSVSNWFSTRACTTTVCIKLYGPVLFKSIFHILCRFRVFGIHKVWIVYPCPNSKIIKSVKTFKFRRKQFFRTVATFKAV